MPAMKHWHFVPPYTCSHLLTLMCQKMNTLAREFVGLLSSPAGISITWKYIQPLAQSPLCASGHSLEYFCGSSVCIFLDLCVWEQQEAICSFMQEGIGPAKFLLLHRPIQSFKYKSLQALYFPYVPPKVPVLTFISQGLPQTHPHLPRVHASITPPFCISTVRWRTNPNLIYRLCFFRVHIHSSSEVRFNHMHISFSSMSNTYACGF